MVNLFVLQTPRRLARHKPVFEQQYDCVSNPTRTSGYIMTSVAYSLARNKFNKEKEKNDADKNLLTDTDQKLRKEK